MMQARVFYVGAHVRYDYSGPPFNLADIVDNDVGKVIAVRLSQEAGDPFSVCVVFVRTGDLQYWVKPRDLDLISEQEYMTVLASFTLGVAPEGKSP